MKKRGRFFPQSLKQFQEYQAYEHLGRKRKAFKAALGKVDLRPGE